MPSPLTPSSLPSRAPPPSPQPCPAPSPQETSAWLAWDWVNPATGEGANICSGSPTAWGVGSFSLQSCPCQPPSPSPPPPAPPPCGTTILSQESEPVASGYLSGPIRDTANGWEVGAATVHVEPSGPDAVTLSLSLPLPAGTVIKYNFFDWVG